MGVDSVDDRCKVLGTVLVVEVIDFDSEYSSPILLEDKFLVELVPPLEVVDGHGLFVHDVEFRV